MKKISVSYFISQRLNQSENSYFSALITKIAIGSIALGFCVIVMAFFIFGGFKKNIQEKIFSFTAHIQIFKYDANNSYENQAISTQKAFFQQSNPLIEKMYAFSQKPALLKTEEEVMGVLLKSVDQNFDTLRFKNNLISGKFIEFSDSSYVNQLVISKFIADKLNLQIADSLIVYFIQDPPRLRKMRIQGIYESNIEDFDQKIVFADQKLVQRLNNWADTLVGGYELFIQDFEQLNPVFEQLFDQMDYDMQASTVETQYGHFFQWFVMLNRNVFVFLVIILFVACFNTASILLILIMERTQMIGMLKALGAKQWQIRNIFIFNGLRMLGKGLLLGNMLALGLSFLQDRLHIFPLNPEYYYMTYVPIAWDWQALLGVNALFFAVVSLLLLLPTTIISRISPIQAIRFD